jgi:hypothetical protein
MKEDYLWDKTGDDAEIKKFEIALQGFRYRENPAPALPAKAIPFTPPTSRRRRFRVALVAVAACAAFSLLALGIGFQLLKSTPEIQNSLAVTETSKITAIDNQNILANNETPNFPVKTADHQTRTTAARIIKTRQISPLNRRKEIKSPNYGSVKNNNKVTKEEQDAYDQLMLALSITGSKLKIVKDKVDGSEE